MKTSNIKRMKRTSLFALMSGLLLTVIGLASCSSDDDDETGGQQGSINMDVVGVWYCTFQQWTEDGDTWSSTYEPSSKYMMAFEEDGTGYMKSGSDELFEIGTHGIEENFNWYAFRKGGKYWIHEDNRNHDFEITSVSSSSLTLTWRAPDSAYGYTIVGKFKKMN